jgi:hypothetical protein
MYSVVDESIPPLNKTTAFFIIHDDLVTIRMPSKTDKDLMRFIRPHPRLCPWQAALNYVN